MTLPDYKRANRSVACSRCGAGVGEPCHTPAGKTTNDHAARIYLTSQAFRIGVEGGLHDALGIFDWQGAKYGEPEVTAALEEIRDQLARHYNMIRRGNLRREHEGRV